MAALSAIAAYDVSDAESDEEINADNSKDDNVKVTISPNEEEISPKIENEMDIDKDNDEIEKTEIINADANNGHNEDSDISMMHEIIDDDEDDHSMMISEEEKESSEAVDSEPAKLKFKRYSCDSATALALKLKNMTDDELHLPPEPEGRCSNQLQNKIKRLYEKKIKEGENLNQKVQERKDFRNPSIYDKLILFIGIEERGTNFSKSDYNPSFWRKVPDYENLARAQREDVAKKERERKTKVEFVTGTVKKTASGLSNTETTAKKTKWDAPADDRNSKTSSKTIISAVGPVKKTKS